MKRTTSNAQTLLVAELLGACGTSSGQPSAANGVAGSIGTPPVASTAGKGDSAAVAMMNGSSSSPAAVSGAGANTGAPSAGRSGSANGGAGAGSNAGSSASGASRAGSMSASGEGGADGSPISAGGAGGTVAAGSGGVAGTGVGSAPSSDSNSCTSLPPVTDYAAAGPFADAKMFSSLGPGNNYTMYRPDASLGKDGFKHPIATWGNGIATTPDMYQKLLKHIASHGFVVIGCNDTQAERQCLSDGMDWLVKQNTEDGPLKGKLDTTREVTIGYSWGGGAAIDTADRPNVRATFSLHGMPPRVSDAFDKMHAPLLLTTSTGDNFVTASQYVTPNYEKAKVQTFYATLDDATVGHLYIADQSAGICIGEVLGGTFGNCGDAEKERAPAVAWLRFWVCGDEGARTYFYGDNCTMCQKPWTSPQRKNWQ